MRNTPPQLLAIACLFLAISGCGEDSAEPHVEGTVRLRGVIATPAETDSNIRPVLLELANLEGSADLRATTSTDDDGRFTFATNPGPHRLTLTSSGSSGILYVSTDGSVSARPDTFWVDEGVESVDTTIPLGTVDLLVSLSGTKVDPEDWIRRPSAWLEAPSDPGRLTYVARGEPLEGAGLWFRYRHVPDMPLVVRLLTPFGETIYPQVAPRGELADSVRAELGEIRNYETTIGEPAIFAVEVAVAPADLQPTGFSIQAYREPKRYAATRSFLGSDSQVLELPIYGDKPVKLAVWSSSGARVFIGGPDFESATEFLPQSGTVVSLDHEFGGLRLRFPADNQDFDAGWILFSESGGEIDGPFTRVSRVVTNVSPGSYRVAFRAGGLTSERYPFQWHDLAGSIEETALVEVRTGEITEVDWTPWPGASCRGTLSRPLQPGERMWVESVSQGVSYSNDPSRNVVSEGKEFTILRLPQMEFRLWILRNGIRWYFPGTADVDEATLLRIENLQDIEGIHFEL